MTSIESRIKELIPEIISQFPAIEVMYLFGSHACRSATTESDVDVAVFTDGRQTVFMDIELGAFLEDKLAKPVDVVIMQKVSPILQHEVLRNKIRLFEKNPDRRLHLENRSLRAYFDARHYQEKRTFWKRQSHGQDRRHQAFVEQS